MKLDLDSSATGHVIRAYEAGHVVVDDKTLTRSFVLTPERLLTDWAPQSVEQLQAEHLEPLAELAPELVLLGSGTRLRWPRPEVLEPLRRRGIAVEVMDNGAACRSYSILHSEHRKVAVALMLESA